MGFIDCEQNTEEWFALRAGKVTGSTLAKIMANYGKAFGEPAKKAAVNIALEQINGKPLANENYSNAHMERGHEQESIARALYEARYFVKVENGGFFDNGDTGCSPDGRVGKDGLIEIKSVIGTQQYKTIKSESYDTAYKWQLIDNLKETEREWIDYTSYCADFPEGKQLYIYRLHADDVFKEFRMIDVRMDQFRELIEEAKQRILAQ